MSIVPIQKLTNDISIKRDDLLPFSFGGNKYRIACEFIEDMEKQGKNCIIGYGSARSNLSRVLSALCSQKGIPCYLISPAENDGSRIDTNNSFLCRIAGAEFIYCEKSQVAETVENTIALCEKKGLKPYYINGNKYGQGNEKTPVKAYVKAFKEIAAENDFDYIFTATGTGMTQSGLIAGKIQENKNTKIIGISVAREKQAETNVIRKYVEAYLGYDISDDEITVVDDYLCGGYGKYDSHIQETILRVYKEYGIPLDPTYTGKAFYGMLDYLEKNNLFGKNILFIHTGGSPLFFDFIKKISVSIK